MATVIDMSDPSKREAVALIQMRAMLQVEVRTGLRHSRGSVLNRFNETFGKKYNIKAHNKRQAIQIITKILKEQHNFDPQEGLTSK